jgi:AcrR family transcriptional regulator
MLGESRPGRAGVSNRAIAGDQQPARKQQQRSIVTQQKLLDAAVEAFSESGFKGTSTRDIADRAGVHHPLITYHFKNKDQLWRSAADRIFREFNISLVKAMAEVPESRPRARAETFIRTYVRYAYNQPALHKFILQESSHPSARLDWLVENHLKPLFDIVVKSLRELQELGIAPPGDPAILFNMIRVSAGGLLALSEEIKGTSNIDFESEDNLDELAGMIVRCFLPGDEINKP